MSLSWADVSRGNRNTGRASPPDFPSRFLLSLHLGRSPASPGDPCFRLRTLRNTRDTRGRTAVGGTGPSEGWSPPRKVSVAGQGGTRPEIFQDLPKALKTDFSRFAGSQSPQREGSCQRQGPRRLCAHLPTACPPVRPAASTQRASPAVLTGAGSPAGLWGGSALQAPLGRLPVPTAPPSRRSGSSQKRTGETQGCAR